MRLTVLITLAFAALTATAMPLGTIPDVGGVTGPLGEVTLSAGGAASSLHPRATVTAALKGTTKGIKARAEVAVKGGDVVREAEDTAKGAKEEVNGAKKQVGSGVPDTI